MEIDNFSDVLTSVQAEAATRDQRLIAEYRAVWKDTESLIQAATEAAKQNTTPGGDRATIASLRDFFEGPGRRLSAGVIKQIRGTRAQERALAALESHEAGREELAQRAPQRVTLSGAALVEALGTSASPAWRAHLTRRRKRIELPLRGIIHDHFLQEADHRARLDGAYFLILAKVSVALLEPWQEMRRSTLRAFAGQAGAEADFEVRRKSWLAQVKELEARAAKILGEIEGASAQSASRLAQAALRCKTSTSGEGRKLRRQEQFSFWARQQRAVLGVVDLESQFNELASDLLKTARESLNAVEAEHTDVLEEIEAAMAWLRDAQTLNITSGFPPPSSRLLSAEDRARGWNQSAEFAGRSRLANELETVEPRGNLPSWPAPWRTLKPLSAFLFELDKTGNSIVLEGFQRAEAEHGSIIREIERSREVVAYSLEAADSDPEVDTKVAREGLANALALVTYLRENANASGAVVERQFVRAIAATLLSTHGRLEHGRLGLLAHFAKQSGTQGVRTIWDLMLRQLSAGAQWTAEALGNSYHWLLLKVGWETPPVAAYEPVIARGYLGDVLDLQVSTRDLPAIYRRLFRLAPVEDSRFLIGREVELSALAQVRSLWQENRAVSVLLVGARGSGKTSLLNCGLASEFAEAEIIRSQFVERLTSRQAMREFVRNLVQIPDGQELISALSSNKSVVVLEELERTFLRRMNGFEALHELLAIVSATSRTTLWILGMNEHAYRYLDAATGLGQYFSHRINAMAISPQHFKNAILLRHKLSGLRLQYPPAAAIDPRADRLRRLLGIQHNAEEMFFESLYVQSEGIFRSAFELWQHYAERAEGGVLYMKRPIEPDAEPLISRFNQDDAFTLQAILHHGSLTNDEHAAIFEVPLEVSRMRMEKLTGLECLEADPSGPGMRVRPEAGRVVHTALNRLNLL